MRGKILAGLAAALLAGCGAVDAGRRATTAPTIAAPESPSMTSRLTSAAGLRKDLPPTRWGEENTEWTEAALAALETEGITLLSSVPADVMQYCPGYATQTKENRKAFWTGFISAMAHHDGAANAGPQGTSRLLRITRPAKQFSACAGSRVDGESDGASNIRCAVQVMTQEITRDGAIASQDARQGWRGLARSWAPLRSPQQRSEIANWTRKQSYCK